jgi:hypothetical protein
MKKIKCSQCELNLEIVFEGDKVQYPIFSCPTHGGKNEWKKWWEEYSTIWQKKECWENVKDKPSCLLGYFCHKYFEFYSYPFTFDISNPVPYKGKEFTMIRRLIAMFDGDAKEAAKYVKWTFHKKIQTKKRAITSIGFFVNSNMVNEYKHEKAQSLLIKRCTMLPEDYLDWCCKECPEIFEKHDFKTWNDLNALVSYFKVYKIKDVEYNVLMEAVNRKLLSQKNGEPDFRPLED